MKKLIAISILITFCFSAFCQDVITFKDGEQVECKIIEVGVTEIKYNKYPPSESSPLYVVKKSEVFMIKYEDGTTDLFKAPSNEEDVSKILPQNQNACIKGEKDALKYHKPERNILLGLGFGVFGIIGVAVLNDPRPPDLARIPEPKLVNDAIYLSCYKKRAHKKNMNSAVLGTLVSAVIILAIR